MKAFRNLERLLWRKIKALKMRAWRLSKQRTSVKAETPDEGMASSPKPEEDISRFPLPAQEEIINHETAVQYVKTVVHNYLFGSVKDLQTKNPMYQRNALTNFLLMTLCSSFLDVVREAGRKMYVELEGHRSDYYNDKNWIQMDELNLKRWSAHGRTGWVWQDMTSLGVENFCPDDPADMEKWQDWLTQEQVVNTMQWLFDNCWRARANRWNEFENRMQLWGHWQVFWNYYSLIVTVHLRTTGNLQPGEFPSCWTWEGFLRTQRMKYVEKVVMAFRSKIASAEPMARMHAESFALEIDAIVYGNG